MAANRRSDEQETPSALRSCTDSNQPLATIDVRALTGTRFLLDRPGRPALPYRDAEGCINVHLCTASEKELAQLLSQREVVPQGVQDKLKTWTKHARAWHKTEGPTWVREETSRGAEWVSSAGQRRRELSQLQPKAEEAAAMPLQRESTESSSRVASRVGGTEAERRRQMMANIAAGRGGRKRPADGEGGGASGASPGAREASAHELAKRSRGEPGSDGAEAREARERKQAEKAARRAEKEQEAAAREERKAAKTARRAAKAARRAAREGGEGGRGEGEGEEEEASDESEDESEAEEEGDDSEQVLEDTSAK